MGNYFFDKEVNCVQKLINDSFDILYSIFDSYFPDVNLPNKKYKNILKENQYDMRDAIINLKNNIDNLNNKCNQYSKVKFNYPVNFKSLREYINILKDIHKYLLNVNFNIEIIAYYNSSILIFEKIIAIVSSQKMEKNQNNYSDYNDNFLNQNAENKKFNDCGSKNILLMKSKQKEELMMAGDNIGRMLSTAEGLVNKLNKKELFNKYQDYDFFESRNIKSELEIFEQLISQIEFAEINYSLYLKDHHKIFPFDEENNLETICKDIDNMEKYVPNNYKFLFTAMKNLLLRKDNSEFIKIVEKYDQENTKKAKMDPKILAAYGVPISHYHEEKKMKANEGRENTYKFNIKGKKDQYKKILTEQGTKNVEIMKEYNEDFSNL